MAKRCEAPAFVLTDLEAAHPRAEMELSALIRCGFWMEAFEAVDGSAARHLDDRHRLPLHHLAMNAKAPLGIVVSLKMAYPIAANVRDKAGWLPLHYSTDAGGPAEQYREVDEKHEKLLVDEFRWLVPAVEDP